MQNAKCKVQKEVQIREAGGGLLAAQGPGGEGARDFRVALIREGLARSGRYFARTAVEEVARAADGLRAFANHPTPSEDRERPVRSVRDMVGFYRDPATTFADGRLQAEATLHLFESAEWLASMAREALQLGRPDVIGLSIDSVAVVRPGEAQALGLPGPARQVPVVEGVRELKSVDVVTRPSAGGQFLSIQEAELMNDTMQVENGTTGTTGQIGTNGTTGTTGMNGATGMTGAAGTPAGREAAQGVQTVQAEALAQATALLAQVREAQLALDCRRTLDERLAAAAGLPGPVAAKVRRLHGPNPAFYPTQEAYGEALDAAIAAEQEVLEQLRGLLSPAGRPLVTGYGAVRVTVAEADRQRVLAQVALDRLFGLPQTDADADWQRAGEYGLHPSIPQWLGIREAYVALTGDALVTGRVHPEGSIVREANEVTTSVLNQALLNSMTKRLVLDYRGQPQWWRPVVSVVPVRDFKTQDRIRLHDFAALSTVAENGAYTNLAWDDARETYAPAKRGNLVVVTREAILNDDVNAIRKIPAKLARSAGITINEFVANLFTSNPTMQDGTKVFDDGVQTNHANRGTTALSHTALKAAMTTMLKQTDSAGKRLGVRPRFLLVPVDLLFTALEIVNSTLAPGTANNDANVLRGAAEPIAVPQFTDTNDWYLTTDPADVETVELGFVGGREEPELLMQDAPDQGSVFTNDAISFKIRWEFGGGWLDYRGAFVANV